MIASGGEVGRLLGDRLQDLGRVGRFSKPIVDPANGVLILWHVGGLQGIESAAACFRLALSERLSLSKLARLLAARRDAG